VSGKKRYAYDIIPLRPTRPAWMLSAPCASADPEIWFDHLTVVAAKRICDTCPFKSPCVTYAITHGEIHGVWGGLSAPQRADLTEADLYGDRLDGQAA
jgi:WhiB family redox-sensing transcriptional regulator